MAFELHLRICERCDDFVAYDSTKAYESTDNPGGYGQVNLPANPNDFDTYVLNIWGPDTDPNGAPTYVLNMLASPLVVNADGDYPFTVAFAALGLDLFVSGRWTFQSVATYELPDTTIATYTADYETVFMQDITKKVMGSLLQTSVETGDWERAAILLTRLEAACFAAGCGYLDQATAQVDWLYQNYRQCC